VKFSSRRIIVAKVPNPRIDLLPRRKRWKRPKKCHKRILLCPRGPQNGTIILEDKLDSIALFEAEPVPDLNGNGNLPFATDGAGRRHLYLTSMK
jgi:hypothetical protein